MTATFDLVLKGGTIANQDGVAPGDVGVRDGRIAALGSLGTASAGEVIAARACTSCRASSTARSTSANRGSSTRRTWRRARAPRS
jgi:dihydroorotase-like cyclic amidohydrolase